jgi:hypothetical protein
LVNFSRINGSLGIAPSKRESLPLPALRIRFPWRLVSETAFRAKTHQRRSLSHGAPVFRRIRARQTGTMRTIFVVVMLALLTIAFEIYSEAALMGGAAPHAGPDPAALAIAHGLKHG